MQTVKKHPLSLDDGGFTRPIPPFPTHYLPGTREKIAVMQQRYVDGYAIHHPNDTKLNESPLVFLRQLRRGFDNRPIHPDSIEDNRSIIQKVIEEATGVRLWSIDEEC